ncbi:11363_t:CDS:2, partial [Gigaspora margarita]
MTVFKNISDPVNKFYWFVTVNNLNEPLRHLKYISDKNESTRYAVGSEFKPEKNDGHLRGPCTIILESIQLFRWIDLNINNAQAIRDLEEEIRDLKRKLVEDREERDNKSIPTTKTKSTTTFTFSDIPSHTTIDDISISTITTTTTTILSKTTTNTNTITTNSPKPTKILTHLKLLFHLFLQNKHLKIITYKNPLSKETIYDKLKIKKQSTSFTKMKEIINKITDIRIKKIIEEIQKLIETYGEQFINYIPKEMKKQILYNFNKIMIVVI